LFDSSVAYIDVQKLDVTELLAAGVANTGTEILFNGSQAFPDLYPLSAGGPGGLLASVHNFRYFGQKSQFVSPAVKEDGDLSCQLKDSGLPPH
jgi:hypothetical protein